MTPEELLDEAANEARSGQSTVYVTPGAKARLWARLYLLNHGPDRANHVRVYFGEAFVWPVSVDADPNRCAVLDARIVLDPGLYERAPTRQMQLWMLKRSILELRHR